MAIDSRDKSAAITGYSLPFVGALPLADASLDADDSMMLTFLYPLTPPYTIIIRGLGKNSAVALRRNRGLIVERKKRDVVVERRNRAVISET